MGKAAVSTEPCRDRGNVRQVTKYRSWIHKAHPVAIKNVLNAFPVDAFLKNRILEVSKPLPPHVGVLQRVTYIRYLLTTRQFVFYFPERKLSKHKLRIFVSFSMDSIL